jgi:hypothetical protein
LIFFGKNLETFEEKMGVFEENLEKKMEKIWKFWGNFGKNWKNNWKKYCFFKQKIEHTIANKKGIFW